MTDTVAGAGVTSPGGAHPAPDADVVDSVTAGDTGGSGAGGSGAGGSGAGGSGAGGDTADPTRRAPSVKRRRTTRRLVVVFALLVAAIAYLLVEGLGSSLDYFDTVQQAINHKHKIGTTVIRLEGTVVKGSIIHTGSGADFDMSGGGHTVRVIDVGSLPTLFQPNIPVVVVGHFPSVAAQTFYADQIMVKHSATYIAAHPKRVKGRTGKEAP